jgi:hypothetical protein
MLKQKRYLKSVIHNRVLGVNFNYIIYRKKANIQGYNLGKLSILSLTIINAYLANV